MSTLLLVDDAAYMRRLVGIMAKKGGHKVVGETETGIQAVELYAQLKPDLVILDILMPDIDGIEVMLLCKQFKPDIYIIAISGGGRIDAEHYLRLATELGANAILRKPFTVNELLKSIEKVLGEK